MQANTKSEFPQVKKFLEKEYGKKLEDLFEEFEPEPLGVASLAQVHKAKLKDGTPVAVKVQHSYVLRQSIGDIYLVKFACFMTEKIFKEFKYTVYNYII
jgi:aarF domain-containing kinase